MLNIFYESGKYWISDCSLKIFLQYKMYKHAWTEILLSQIWIIQDPMLH